MKAELEGQYNVNDIELNRLVPFKDIVFILYEWIC